MAEFDPIFDKWYTGHRLGGSWKDSLRDAYDAGYAAGKAAGMEEAAKICESRISSMEGVADKVSKKECAAHIRKAATK